MNIEECQKIRERITERLIKKASAETEANHTNNIGNTRMDNLQSNSNNVNPTMAAILNSFTNTSIPKVCISTTDVHYIEFLIEKNDLPKARTVLNNMKSVAKILNEQIIEFDNFLASYEV